MDHSIKVSPESETPPSDHASYMPCQFVNFSIFFYHQIYIARHYLPVTSSIISHHQVDEASHMHLWPTKALYCSLQCLIFMSMDFLSHSQILNTQLTFLFSLYFFFLSNCIIYHIFSLFYIFFSLSKCQLTLNIKKSFSIFISKDSMTQTRPITLTPLGLLRVITYKIGLVKKGERKKKIEFDSLH